MNRVSILLLPLACAACAKDARTYPSLAVRPAENLGFAEPTRPPEQSARQDPTLDADIARSDGARVKASAAFDAAAGRATRLVAAARGNPVGSEAWIAAQVAIAELDGLRAESLDVLTALDDMAAARAGELAAEYPALTRAREQAREITVAQRARIDTLARQLPAA